MDFDKNYLFETSLSFENLKTKGLYEVIVNLDNKILKRNFV